MPQVLRIELRGLNGAVLGVHNTAAGAQLARLVGHASALHQLSTGTLAALLDDSAAAAQWSTTYLSNPCESACVVAIALRNECCAAVAGVIVYCKAVLPNGELPDGPLAPLSAEALRPVYFKSCVVTSQLPEGMAPAVNACVASADAWFTTLEQSKSPAATPAATPARPPQVFHASPNPLMAPAPPGLPKRARPAGLETVRNPRHAQLQQKEGEEIAEIASDLARMSHELAAAAEGWEYEEEGSPCSDSGPNSMASEEQASDSLEQSGSSLASKGATLEEPASPQKHAGEFSTGSQPAVVLLFD